MTSNCRNQLTTRFQLAKFRLRGSRSLLTSEGNASILLSKDERTSVPKTDLLQGTLDLLILKILTLGPNHGWGISNRIRQISRDGLNASQGSLYPALHRLELNGDVASEMTASENNRRARVYRLTPSGRRRLENETASWEQFALSMRRILQAG
jgi:PadR family transcriptional regulator PadR